MQVRALLAFFLLTACTSGDHRTRFSHRVAIVDLDRGELDDAFPVVELAGGANGPDGAVVDFRPEYALSRASLVHAAGKSGRGYVHVSFGNVRDIQPFHGFVFELDLDAWRGRGEGAAISAVLVITPEKLRRSHRGASHTRRSPSERQESLRLAPQADRSAVAMQR